MAKNQTKQNQTDVMAVLKKNKIAVMTGAVALCLGLIIGHFVSGSSIKGVTNLPETTFKANQSGEIIAQYNYKGLKTISLQDMIDAGGMSTAANGDYNIPSAENVMSVVRMKILEEEAKAEGINVTDADIDNYVKNVIKMDSVKAVADAYQYEEEQLKTLLKETVIQYKFQEKIAGKHPTLVDAPTAPAEDADANEATEEYAKLIQEIVGDEWNTKANDGKGGWADKDSEYAKAAKDYTITNKAATYDAAAAVYQVAYNKYSAELTEFNQKVNEYTNNIFKDVTVTIATAVQ